MTTDAPQNAHQSGLLRHSVLLLFATQFGNVATMLFQILMMRQLSRIEYGMLASMLSLVLITGTPLEALRTAVAHQTALLMRMGQGGALRAFLRHWARSLLVAAALIVLIGWLGRHGISTLLQLPAPGLVILTGFIVAGSLFMPYFQGALQGGQAFTWMAIHGQVWGVVRFVIGALLVWIWVSRSIQPTAMTALSAQMMAVVASVAVGGWAVARLIRRQPVCLELPFAGWNYFLLSLAVLIGYAVLMNADVALVKIFFDPEQAGVFAQAATIGRSIVFLPVPIAAVMFPKVVSAGVSTAGDRRVMLKALLFTAALIGLAGFVCTVWTPFVWWIFTGSWDDPAGISLVRGVIWALSPLGLTFLLMNFELAQRRFWAPLLLLVLAGVYVVCVAVWHDRFGQVLTIMGSVNVASMILMFVAVFRPVRAVVDSAACAIHPARTHRSGRYN